MKGLWSAFIRFRIMAYVTGVLLAVLTVWALVGYLALDYANAEAKPLAYEYGWMAHGFFYILYFVFGVDLCFRMRFGVLKTVGVLIAGTIPFMSFVAEVAVHKDVNARLASADTN